MKKGNQVHKQLKHQIEKILTSDRKKAFNYKQLAALLGIKNGEGREAIMRNLKLLEKENVIEEIAPGKYIALHISHFIEGTVQITQRGTGYLIQDIEGQSDILIENDNLNTALNGDRVKVNLFAHSSGGKQTGEVVEIIERKKSEFVGVLQLNFTYAFMVPDDKRLYTDIFIPQNQLNKAKNGDKVVVRITEWNANQKNPIGEVVQILGKPGEHQTEMHAIIAEFGFSTSFPGNVEKEADSIPDKIPDEEIKKRRDFRDICTITIDPEDAKDFDDALSIRKAGEGLWEIGVHIADVSHYVQTGTSLDDEALRRATSVYLVDRTVPMLPEKLSNGVCSLRPHEDKLTFSTVFILNEQAEVQDTWIGKTVIHSNRRLTYEQAQEQIETKSGEYAEELSVLNKLALLMKAERFRNGAVNFETEEVKFKLDEQFRPVGIFKKVRKDAHKLIEEFMLLSNRTVATWAYHLGKGDKKKTFVYRVHESPSEEKLRLFSNFATRFGYQIKTTSEKAIAHSFNKLLLDVEGKPEQNIIQSMAVRSMMKAYYTTQKTSHYGLGFDFYTHFTSPIRRYPDLMVHRLIALYLQKGKSPDPKTYEAMCRQSSQMEIQAAEAERASIRYKQVEYISGFIGQAFTGIISGVTEWGMYVEITEYKCEGMVRLSSLADDYYEFDEYNQWIVGRNSRKVYQLGGQVEVVVKQADMLKRQIDLDLLNNSIISKTRKKVEKHHRKEEKRKSGQGKVKAKKKRRR